MKTTYIQGYRPIVELENVTFNALVNVSGLCLLEVITANIAPNQFVTSIFCTKSHGLLQQLQFARHSQKSTGNLLNNHLSSRDITPMIIQIGDKFYEDHIVEQSA